ncbi:hypothetical protein OH492_29420 [Vibrio chagasii]|nr:hypothetical protein [Vibrio chagasii]
MNLYRMAQFLVKTMVLVVPAPVVDDEDSNIDFGDAPDGYLALLASNGPRHELDGVLVRDKCTRCRSGWIRFSTIG